MYKKVGEFTPDKLIAGNELPILTEEIKLAKAQGVVKRGTVVGIVTTDGTAKPVDSAQSDGTQLPYAILTDDVDTAGAADVVTTAYTTGLFNASALIFGGSDDVSKHKLELRKLGIHLK